MLCHENTTWDDNLIDNATVADGEEVTDTVAQEAVSRFQEWIKDVPWLERVAFQALQARAS